MPVSTHTHTYTHTHTRLHHKSDWLMLTLYLCVCLYRCVCQCNGEWSVCVKVGPNERDIGNIDLKNQDYLNHTSFPHNHPLTLNFINPHVSFTLDSKCTFITSMKQDFLSGFNFQIDQMKQGQFSVKFISVMNITFLWLLE